MSLTLAFLLNSSRNLLTWFTAPARPLYFLFKEFSIIVQDILHFIIAPYWVSCYSTSTHLHPNKANRVHPMTLKEEIQYIHYPHYFIFRNTLKRKITIFSQAFSKGSHRLFYVNELFGFFILFTVAFALVYFLGYIVIDLLPYLWIEFCCTVIIQPLIVFAYLCSVLALIQDQLQCLPINQKDAEAFCAEDKALLLKKEQCYISQDIKIPSVSHRKRRL